MNNRVNCGKPEMAIRSQASSKCDEGSETRLHDLTGFYVNLSVEYKGYESPRAPDNQAMQKVWSLEALLRVLREKSFKVVQGMPVGKVASEVSKNQRISFGAMRGVPQGKCRKDKAVFEGLVQGKS